jgi:multiple sugar transport system ATP-binding protein
MAAVALSEVRKIYDNGFVAVERASFEIAEGELLVFVGPSGCGKSTLLRMIAGLESVTEGTISIAGRVVNDIPPKQRDIAMVFQSYALYPHMSVYQNMAFSLKLRNVGTGDIDRRVRSAATMLGIEEHLDKKPRQLSGGQRQRVALGRAMVREPAVFLLDEPLSNLDAKLRLQTRAEISTLHQKIGATMIYVTHDQIEAMTLGDRIVVLDHGIIQQIDTPMNLYQRPANQFVAAFIGSPSMNFVPGRINGNGQPAFHSDDDSLVIPLDGTRRENLSSGRAVILGVRPEDLSIAGDAVAKLTLDLIEPVGNEIFLHGKTGLNPLVARVPPQPLPSPGETVGVELRTENVHFFDPETGLRIEGSEHRTA